MYKKPYVIAEVGCNHMGQMKIAHELINIAASSCKADVIKFQKRCPRELLTPEQYNAPHPNPTNSYGKTYGEHREHLEFTVEQHAQLKEWCEEAGVKYASSVYDLTSAKEIVSLRPEYIKIPSACNTHFKMLQWICDNFDGEIQLSLGMTSREEEEQIVSFFEKNGRIGDLVLFACTSGYPVSYEDICLLEIRRLKNTYGNRVKAIGFSGHHIGIAADVAAYTLGADIIERHFTLDHTLKGTDHSASLEPDELKQLVRDLNNVYDALTYKSTDILPIEQEQRNKLKYREH